MSKQTEIKIFDEKQVRTHWDSEQEKWFMSITDVIEILTGTDRPRKYWSDLKFKLKTVFFSGSETTVKLPRCRFMICREIANPIPDPVFLVV